MKRLNHLAPAFHFLLRFLAVFRFCRHRTRLLIVGTIAVIGFAFTGPAAENEPAVPAGETALSIEEQKLLRHLSERLRIENELLKKENQQLRRLLLNRAGPTNSVVAKLADISSRGETGGEGESVHWLSVGGKRHNATCRYFQKTSGKPCTATEGTACKICGG